MYPNLKEVNVWYASDNNKNALLICEKSNENDINQLKLGNYYKYEILIIKKQCLFRKQLYGQQYNQNFYKNRENTNKDYWF